jgi:diguanylate cyclase (GGDEF)-like protein
MAESRIPKGAAQKGSMRSKSMESSQTSGQKKDPYAGLLLTLMPGAMGFGLFNAAGAYRWIQSEKQMTAITGGLQREAQAVVSQTLAQRKALMTVLSDGNAAYAFPLGDGAKVHLGTLVVLTEGAASGRALRSLQMVAQLVRPALHCISRDMLLQKALGKVQRDTRAQSLELQFLRDLDKAFESAPSLSLALERILDRALKTFDLATLGISMPEYRVHCHRTDPAGGVNPSRTVPVHAEKNLLAWVSMHGRCVRLPGSNPDEAIPVDIDPRTELIACPMRAGSGAVVGVLLATFKEGGLSKQTQPSLEVLARRLAAHIETRIDTISGALCRPAFEGELERLTGIGEKHSLIYMDLDRLNRVRGEFGAKAKDDILSHFCSLVTNRFQGKQIFGRLGETSFGLLLPGVGADDALQQARQVCNSVTSLHYLNGEQGVSMSVSVGVAESAGSGDSSGSLLAGAESASHRAKMHGGNQVELFQDDSGTGSRNQGEIFLANYLGSALEQGRFSLVAQAVHQNNPRAAGGYFEVMIRLIDEAGVEMPPGCFLPVADRYGMLPAIDRWVVTRLLDSLEARNLDWLSQGQVCGVNLSRATLEDATFPTFVQQELTRTGIPAAALCFEIAESAMMADVNRSKRAIKSLRDLGCRVALDEFGSGLSALPYLDALPVDFVKVDGRRIMAMANNRVSHSMVAAICAAAKVLELTTVAGCVESEEIDRLIQESGFDLVQGVLMSVPEPLESFLANIDVSVPTLSVQGKRA